MTERDIASGKWQETDPSSGATESGAAPAPTVFVREDRDVSVHVLPTTPEGGSQAARRWRVAVGEGDVTGSEAFYPVRDEIEEKAAALDVAESVTERYDQRHHAGHGEGDLRRLAESF